MGKLRNVRFNWQSPESDVRVGRATTDGAISLTQLIRYMHAAAPEADPATIMINFATVEWARPATPAELAEREEQNRHRDQRREQWERTKFAELKAKYEPVGADPGRQRATLTDVQTKYPQTATGQGERATP
jgi:hypothetical protein